MSFSPEDMELIEEFVVESRELLDDVEVKLITLEKSRAQHGRPDRNTLDAVFRAFHSIKGSAGFLDLSRLVQVTHIAESLLDDLRAERYDLDATHVNVLCEALDFSRAALELVEGGSSDDGMTEASQAVVATIRDAISASASGKTAPPPPPRAQAAPPSPPPAPAPEPLVDDAAIKAAAARGAIVFGDDDPVTGEDEPAVAPPPAPAPRQLPRVQVQQAVSAAPPREGGPRQISLGPPKAAAPASPAARPTPSQAAPAGPPSADAPPTAPAGPAAAAAAAQNQRRESIRVDVEKLDSFMNLVGELILAENMVTHVEDRAPEAETFQQSSMNLNRVTRGLHDIAVAMRMVPISSTFRKMERLVRDLAQKQEKDVQLVISGESTEVDKNLVEAIADPLVHLMRNAIDHGIEAAEERVAVGKPTRGTIHLDARHHGGEVWISVSEDGRGLDRDKILAKAISRGLVDNSALGWPDAAVHQLIFQPGFSTAEAVTDVSGRGVGMDVVRRNIQELKGRIDIASELGQGTTFTLRIPLTLAIIEGMLVEVAGSQYTIPLLSIRESILIGRNTIQQLPDGRELADVRGTLVPVIRLANVHGLPPRAHDASGILVIIEHEGKVAGLDVDNLLGQRQTVIKPLPDYLGDHATIAGCSILSDGQVSLILNLGGLTAHIRAGRGARELDMSAAAYQ